VGLNAGYSWSTETATTTTACEPVGYFCTIGVPSGLPNLTAISADGSGTIHNNAFTGGAQVGYNWQSNNMVVGVEGDIEAYRAKLTTAAARVYPGNLAITYLEGTNVSTNWLSTSRLRVGWANDKVLLYATGGLALTDLSVSDTFSDNNVLGAAVGGSATTKLKAGWTAGAGLEYALSRNWSVRGEYLYVDLGSVSTTGTVTNAAFPGLTNPLSITGKVTANIARAALNYRF
jgi:outer membrane immunogenic protein